VNEYETIRAVLNWIDEPYEAIQQKAKQDAIAALDALEARALEPVAYIAQGKREIYICPLWLEDPPAGTKLYAAPPTKNRREPSDEECDAIYFEACKDLNGQTAHDGRAMFNAVKKWEDGL
jgi:hypothetical protein